MLGDACCWIGRPCCRRRMTREFVSSPRRRSAISLTTACRDFVSRGRNNFRVLSVLNRRGDIAMPSKIRKPNPCRAAPALKAPARHALGTPPPPRTEPASKKRKLKQDKHKPTLKKLLDEAGE